MKKLNNFFEKEHLFKIYLFGWFTSGLFTASLFYFLQKIEGTAKELVIPGEVCLKIGATMGLIFGLMIMLIISMTRKSNIFWESAKVVEELIEKANTKGELQLILDEEFQSLRNKCQGKPHIIELIRLYNIMKAKAELEQDEKTPSEDSSKIYSQKEVLEHLNILIRMPSSELDKYTNVEENITSKWFEQFK